MIRGHGAKYGRKKESAIAALLSARNHEEAARAAGISLATLKRWLRTPEFQAEYAQARRDIVVQTNARIQQNSGIATSVLLKLMASPDTPASVKARVSQFFIEHSNSSMELEDILARIAALEEATKKTSNKR